MVRSLCCPFRAEADTILRHLFLGSTSVLWAQCENLVVPTCCSPFYPHSSMDRILLAASLPLRILSASRASGETPVGHPGGSVVLGSLEAPSRSVFPLPAPQVSLDPFRYFGANKAVFWKG